MAARCEAASVLPVFFSTQGTALSASIAGQGGKPSARERSRSAAPLLAVSLLGLALVHAGTIAEQ